jgi:hypothetical protein
MTVAGVAGAVKWRKARVWRRALSRRVNDIQLPALAKCCSQHTFWAFSYVEDHGCGKGVANEPLDESPIQRFFCLEDSTSVLDSLILESPLSAVQEWK